MKRALIVLILLSFVQCNPLFANDIIKFSTMDLPPWGFYDEKGNASGVYSDIASEIAKDAGISFENTIVPYSRMIDDLEKGNADVIMLFPNERIKKNAILLAPLFFLENIVIGLKGTHYTSLEDLHGKVVGQVRGANYDDRLTWNTLINKYPTTNYKQNFIMLFAKRFHAIAGPSVSIFFTAKKMGYSREQLGDALVLNTKEVCAFYSKRTAAPQMISKLKNTIKKLKNKHCFEEILKRYEQF